MKKGFTLTELLVVVALIAILTLIAIPSVNVITKNINERNYNNKVDMIVSAAELYASNKPEIFNGKLEVKIYVADLLNSDYLKAEESSGSWCTSTSIDGKNVETSGCIVNPTTKSSMNNNWVLVKNEAIGYTSVFGGEEKTFDGVNLVEAVCEKLKSGAFIGKYAEDDSNKCICKYSSGEVTDIVKSSDGTSVEACIISGFEKNNYLYYDDRYFRVVGLYNLKNKGSDGIVAKVISDDGIESN